MFVLGLTGSIGMGKSTTADMFRGFGVPVHDADAAVHDLFTHHGAAVAPIRAAFPNAVTGGRVDRSILGQLVFDDPIALARLEAIVHPLVGHAEKDFLAGAARRRCPIVVLDIPLLYETGGEDRCDAVVVVTAPAFLQARRVLGRPGMTREKLAAILARQTPDGEKRRRADFLIQTGLGKKHARDRVGHILDMIKGQIDA